MVVSLSSPYKPRGLKLSEYFYHYSIHTAMIFGYVEISNIGKLEILFFYK